MSSDRISISMDSVTLVSQECIKIISEVRKNSRFFQSGVAAILSSSDTINLFNDEFLHNFKSLKFTDDSNKHNINLPKDINGLQTPNNTNNFINNFTSGINNTVVSSFGNSNNDPILGGFLQLKALLSEIDHLNEIDTLTILQPYFMLITSPNTSGLITSITIGSLIKLFEYNVLLTEHNTKKGTDILLNINQLINSLVHTQFESSDATLDDSVILRVLDLILRVINNENFNKYLTNEVLFETIHVNLALACNKKRSEVLRRYAEQSLNSITIILFNKLSLDLENSGNEVTIDFFYKYLLKLTSIILIENQYYHTESTKIFVLGLISTIIEVSGKSFSKFPIILRLVQNNLFKSLLTIILKNDNLNLLQAALQCFISLNLILSQHLTLQLEFAYENIFKSILPSDEFNNLDESIDEEANKQLLKKENRQAGAQQSVSAIANRNAHAKELIIESLSLLWSHSSELLIELFINFDCKFDSKNIGLIFIKFLNKLAESSSAEVTTNNVPPICLEGLLQFVNGLNTRVKSLKKNNIQFSMDKFYENKILKIKARKEEFLKILHILNAVDFRNGLKELQEKNFLCPTYENDSEYNKDLAEFFYFKSDLINKKSVGEFIAKPKNLPILVKFLSNFRFKGKRVDEALRLLLQKFRIPGESQQIERVVENFADKYVNDQNFEAAVKNYEAKLVLFEKGELKEEPIKPVTPEKDGVFILSYAIIMLNTDLHNPKIKNHMSFEDFKKNLKGVYINGTDYPEWYLDSIYSSIKNKEIIIPEEHYGTDKWFEGSWDLLINNVYRKDKRNFLFAFEKNIDEPHNNESDFNKIKDGSIRINDFDSVVVSQFDRVLFETSFNMLLKTFIHVFEETGDDHRIAKLMSTIDKCANIASYFKLEHILDIILSKLATMTTLTNEKPIEKVINDEENIRSDIPTTQITLVREKEEKVDTPSTESAIYSNRRRSKDKDVSVTISSFTITVSDLSTWFGRDFKAQISFVALFNIIRKNSINNFSKSWSKIASIILKLFENSLIDGNFFSEFQKIHFLEPLPKVPSRYVIDKTKEKKEPSNDSGVFSAFTSFLKISNDEPPEPSIEEIEATLLTVSCIKTAKVDSLFETLKKNSTNDSKLQDIISDFIKTIPSFNKDTRNAYEMEVLFVFESIVALLLDHKSFDPISIIKDLDKLITVNEKNNRKLFDEYSLTRLSCYLLILVNNKLSIENDIDAILLKNIKLLNTLDKKFFYKCGKCILHELSKLLIHKGRQLTIFNSEVLWNLLRNIGGIMNYSESVLQLLDNLVHNCSFRITPENYMFVLGLFDEISSIGAIGSTFEQEMDLRRTEGQEVIDENPNQNVINISMKCIDLTVDLKNVILRGDFTEADNRAETSSWYALAQALGHQTFNPCRQIRNHAMKVLTSNILALDIKEHPYVTARGVFEFDIFPLVTELLKDEVLYCDFYGLRKTKFDILSNITKIYLQYLNNSYIVKEKAYSSYSELSYIWLSLLDVFNNLIDDEKKQIDIQKKNKKKFPVKKDEFVISESSKELIKNSLLYMQDHGYLEHDNDEHKFLWDETWKKVNDLYPNLQEEFFIELKEIKGQEECSRAPTGSQLAELDTTKFKKTDSESSREEPMIP